MLLTDKVAVIYGAGGGIGGAVAASQERILAGQLQAGLGARGAVS